MSMAEPQTVDQLTLAGRLEIKDVERVQALLIEALAAPRAGGVLAVDVSGLGAIDTAGAQLLLAARREAARCGVRLDFQGETRELRATLELLGLRNFILAGTPP